MTPLSVRNSPLINLAAFVIVVAGMKAASPLVVPSLLTFFFILSEAAGFSVKLVAIQGEQSKALEQYGEIVPLTMTVRIALESSEECEASCCSSLLISFQKVFLVVK